MGNPNQKSEVVVALSADEWAEIFQRISDWLMDKGPDNRRYYSGRYFLIPVLVRSGSTVDELRFERIAEDRARCVEIPSLVVIAR